jgi:hypothetical protein
MQMTKVEVQHNSPEQVRAYLSAARELCEEEYGGAAYPVEVLLKAIDLVAGKSVQLVQEQPTTIGVPAGAIPPPFNGRR